MKRIDRLCRTARHEAGMVLVFFAASAAAGAWAAAALQSGGMLGGTALIVGAVGALALAGTHLRECVRVCDLALKEMEWEVER